MEQYLFAFACSALGLLISVLAWIGARVHAKLDSLTEKMEARLSSINSTLSGIEKDLRKDLVALDRRVSHLEGGLKR